MATSVSASPNIPSDLQQTTSTSSPLPRPPTLLYPALHLGSFDGLSPQPYVTSPLSPARSRSQSTHHTILSSASSASPTRQEFGEGPEKGEYSAGDPVRIDESQPFPAVGRGSRLSVRPSSSSSVSSRSSGKLGRGTNGSIPPPLPPPTMALPPLPILSPISPLGSPSPSFMKTVNGNGGQSFASSSSSLPYNRSTSASRDLPTIPSRARPLGHSLTIHIPGPLSPSGFDKDGNAVPDPILKHSPGIARRRTVIESSGPSHEPSPVRLSGTIDTFSPPAQETPPKSEKRSSVERGSILMPHPQPTPGTEQKAALESPRRLEKKQSTHDLKNSSPSSPTARRSLPRPPKVEAADHTQSSAADLVQTARLPLAVQTQLNSSAPPRQASAPAPMPSNQPQRSGLAPPSAPVPSSSWPPLNVTRSPQAPPPQPQAGSTLKPVSFYQTHQANNSASSLPVIAGLADTGPYPSAISTTPGRAGAGGQNGVGMGRPSGQPAAGPSRMPSKPQEEICLECMMRDRDLADVDVQGEGVWSRASDVDFRDLLWREESVLKSMGAAKNVGGASKLSRSVDDDDDASSEDSDSTSFSPASTGNSVEDAQMRRRIEEKRRRRSMLKAKKRDADYKIGKEVGWRGFKWEEGEVGEGLPRGFRGMKGGRLTEDGLKAVMMKFPSASAFRYQTLQTYLRHQWMLVLDIRTEAQRLGRFPLPEENDFSTSTISSHEGQSVPPGARSSTLAWDTNHARDLSEQMRGAFAPNRTTPGLSVVRPSPSSPANLTALASGPKPTPLQRPMTHYVPEREPVLGAPRAPIYASPISTPGLRPRRETNGSSPGVHERSSQRSDMYDDGNEELWSPSDGTGLRPFSFAVRAGAAAARDGSEGGHGTRRSLWGRWGGSVTSLFGGSQNGSGSMMDMHLGLDNDRRNRSSSINVNTHPRAVSLASPTRPSFFSRTDSRGSSVNHEQELQQHQHARMSRAISHSRLSQVHGDDDDAQPKKKGIKGFFKKMKPKGGKSKTSKSEQMTRVETEHNTTDPGTPLVPPPSISYLVGGNRNDRTKHNRERSGSSSSMLTDGQDSGQNRYSASYPYGLRSVSAPINANGNGNTSSSDVSQSASPTSSKFATYGRRRESFASGKRLSVTLNHTSEEKDRRGSGVEMLSGRGGYMSQEPGSIYDDSTAKHHTAGGQTGIRYPQQNMRPHNKTTSSLSASSGTMAIETPPPITYNSSSFFNQQQQQMNQTPNANANGGQGQPIVKSPSGPLSPNRFKNLPPLPPPGQEPNMLASPDSFTAAFPEQEFNLNGTVHDSKYLSSVEFASSQQTPTSSPSSMRYYPNRGAAGGASNGYGGYPQAQARQQTQQFVGPGRQSLDQRSPRPNGNGNNRMDGRAVQTMYVQPSAMDKRYEPDYSSGEKKKKSGFKGIFGASKAGRMA
ncbi:hypothetical protein CI109_103741 [Kwoniella shandongensis]|uniref:Uncharacterized protein n=1 Tax=Kwoniella shandongensis TaxID=1734106 RepID=A0A5M6CB45_9TREE|nr:uncharacterized protein CI109_000564 [Kwoniella shandongensis]KAA5530992.1 hypothetical protein CI109_000564 [Kwoniella shandongensis]